ncbi:hypothetical protein H0H93_004391 [Arthromyces matolae]|nr:hypothetical protein H0H93_004391 [Arthromyces matolae]
MEDHLTTTPDDGEPSIPPELKELEPDRLYAVLTYRGELASWEWTFFVPDSSIPPVGSSGTLFHVINTLSEHESSGTWKFKAETKDVVSSPHVVAIIRLGDVGFLGQYEDVVGNDSLMPMFKAVVIPDPESPKHLLDFSSRTWFLDAICTLHECGVVTCDDVWLLERELRRFAFSAMDQYLQNKGPNFISIACALSDHGIGWTAYISEQCT